MPNIVYDFLNNITDYLEIIIFPLASISLSVIICFYIYFFIRIIYYKRQQYSFEKPISIIICAKNELDNLKKNLPAILKQNYPNFEVIVVNDQSNDDSINFLNELAAKNKHLVIVEVDDFVTTTLGKKFALTLGIKTAKNEHLLLTDADCLPSSENWAQKMSSNFNNTNIILGYGSYKKEKTLLNKIIRFDTFNVAQQYLSFALANQTYMGVGRNLAYKKSLFFKNKGFASHIHIASGDDDLFIQEITKNNSATIEISEEAHTISETIKNWQDWIYQKRRHISTAPLYKTKFKILLSLYPLSQLLFFLSIILLFILKSNITYTVILLAIKLILSYIINYKTMKKLNTYDLYWLHPLYELLHILIQVYFVLLNLFKKPEKWSR